MEVELAERFGWTYTELDEQDATRVLPGVYASNIDVKLQRVKRWVESFGKITIPTEDFDMWKHALEIAQEYPED